MKSMRIIATLLACVFFASLAMGASNLSYVGGKFIAKPYSNWAAIAQVATGNASTGSSTITVRGGYIVLSDGRTVVPFAVGVPFIVNDANPELVTPTAVSGCYKAQGLNQDGVLVTCSVTASFSFLHGAYAGLLSATDGAAEAANDAFSRGGGVVVIGPDFAVNTTCTNCYATKTAVLAAILIYASVGIEDDSGSVPVYWGVAASTATLYVAPSALTSATVFSSLTVAGSASYAGGTIHVGYECVDPMGNPGPISADYSFADTSAKAIQFTAPPAYANCVGYVPVIGLESGAANNEYEMPLVTQPTVLGAAPVSNGVCTLTTIETIRPACAIANATYGQAGSGAIVTAYPVVTSPQTFQLGGVSSTSYYAPNSMARTGYAYTPGSHLALNGVVGSSGPSTVSAALGSTVPFVLGSIQLPAGFMNTVGRTIRICGQVYFSAMGADTVQAIRFGWDAQGSDATTGIPVFLGGPKMTATVTSAASAASFCQTLETTVASASATGGSIRATNGFYTIAGTSAGANPFQGTNTTVAAVGSLNLAEAAVIDIVFVATTGTTDTPILTNATVEVLN